MLVDGLEAAAESQRAAEAKAARKIARLEKKKERSPRGARSCELPGKKICGSRRNVQKRNRGIKRTRGAPKRFFSGKKQRMCRAEARMRKELADRGVRVSAAWSVREMSRELARLETRRARSSAAVSRATDARRTRAEKAARAAVP